MNTKKIVLSATILIVAAGGAFGLAQHKPAKTDLKIQTSQTAPAGTPANITVDPVDILRTQAPLTDTSTPDPSTNTPSADTSVPVDPTQPAAEQPAPVTVLSENHPTHPNSDSVLTDFYCSFNLSDGTVSPEVFVGRAPTVNASQITFDCPAYKP